MISDEYKALLTKKHDAKPWGGKGDSWIPFILPIFIRFPPGPVTVLDFGCGRGTFKRGFEPLCPDATVIEYDPGVRGKDKLPESPVDYVVCTDVMEHVEERYIVDTLRMINWLAIKGVFFNIDTALSKSLLPDGRNTHITVKPAKWWVSMLAEHVSGMDWAIHRNAHNQLVISGWRTPYE